MNNIMREKPWALSSYLSFNNKFQILELIDTDNNNSKYWVHLNHVDIIEYINNYFTYQNDHDLTIHKSLVNNFYFNSICKKYLPVDSLAHRAETLQIPIIDINRSFKAVLPEIDEKIRYKYNNGLEIPNKYKVAAVKFVLNDNKNNSHSIITSNIDFDKI